MKISIIKNMNKKRIIVGLIILFSVVNVYLFFTKSFNIIRCTKFFFSNYITKKYYVFNYSGIDFYADSCAHNEKIREKIFSGMNHVEKILGPTVYRGKALLTFGIEKNIGKVTPFIWPIGREIKFSSINEFLKIDDKRFYHELIHLVYIDDKAFRNLPEFIIEGVTEALSYQCLGNEDYSFNKFLEDYYMNYLSGFITPDVDFKTLSPYERELYYYFGRIFFLKLSKIDELLLYEILWNPPDEKMSWIKFTQWILTIIENQDKTRDMINRTYLFSPLVRELYVIPVMKIDKIITIHIFIKDARSFISNISCSLKYFKTIENISGKIFINNGYARVEIPWKYNYPVKEIEVKIDTPGENYNQTIKIN